MDKKLHNFSADPTTLALADVAKEIFFAISAKLSRESYAGVLELFVATIKRNQSLQLLGDFETQSQCECLLQVTLNGLYI